MTRSRILAAAMAAALFSAGLAATPTGPAIAADSKQTARPEIGKPIQAAIDALKQGKLKDALAQLQVAEAVPGKTGYESFILDQVKLQYYVKANDSASAVKAAESLLASGQLPPEQVVAYREVVASIYSGLKDCPKANEAIALYYKAGGTDPKFHRVVVSCYYTAGDFTNAAKSLRAIIQTEPKPSEEDLKNLMGIEYKANPGGPGYFDALQQVAKAYPNKGYWHDLILYVQKKPGYTDKLELDVDQLKIATGVLDQPDDYMNAAELAIQGGFPGLAKSILDKGYAAGVLGQGPTAARQKKLADSAAASAVGDQKSLAGEAAGAKSGSELLKLGDAFASYGQYNDAIAAYQKAIQAGSFKTPLEGNTVKLHLGLAYLNSAQKPKAKDAFKSVTGADGTADLAQLWTLQAGL
jgi:tetratricopeptide (TPR) repeat protein